MKHAFSSMVLVAVLCFGVTVDLQAQVFEAQQARLLNEAREALAANPSDPMARICADAGLVV